MGVGSFIFTFLIGLGVLVFANISKKEYGSLGMVGLGILGLIFILFSFKQLKD